MLPPTVWWRAQTVAPLPYMHGLPSLPHLALAAATLAHAATTALTALTLAHAATTALADSVNDCSASAGGVSVGSSPMLIIVK